VNLKDKIVRALAFRWARGKVEALRGKDKETGMGKVLKALDGWKLVIGVVLLTAVKVYDGLNNGHAGRPVEMVLTLLGWNPSADLGVDFGQAAAAVTILIGIGSKVVKAQKQFKAGSSVPGLLSTEGFVAEAVANGKI
jgi:hypothetical protein